MAEEIKDLIEKINQEGIRAAEEKAKKIQEEAQASAEGTLSKAKKEADKLIQDAKQQIAKMDEKENALLAQAGRDLLILLRKEIDALLERIMVSEIQKALDPEAMYKIIADLIKNLATEKSEIIIALSKDDSEALGAYFFTRLKEQAKATITLRPQQDIRAGFSISFDAGKSCFDFSDKALADYIGSYLKPKLNEILQKALSKE